VNADAGEINIKFRARKENGRLVYNRELLAIYLNRFKDQTVFKCVIKRPQKSSSNSQRKYYFGSVLPTLMDHLGYDRDDKLSFHNQLKILYFTVEPDKHGFLVAPSVFTKGAKTTKQAANFINWVQRKAAEYGCYIPDAGE